MSTARAGAGLVAGLTPVLRRVRAYFAPVERTTGTPAIFDAARDGGFDAEAPPAPWVDLGWCEGFARTADTALKPLSAGAPAIALAQTRSSVGAVVEVQFASWGKLQMAVCSGSEQMNLLPVADGGTANGSGGSSREALALGAGSTATSLVLATDPGGALAAGDLVVVDLDYTGQTGFVGSGISGGYVRQASDIGNEADYIRRVSLNVARVASLAGNVATLEAALPAGIPALGMRASRVIGFCDREGGRFFQEWSALFCVPGEQGDRVLYHYPRLQAMRGSAEVSEALPPGFAQLRLQGAFRALPVTDAVDGARVACFRSYLPAASVR